MATASQMEHAAARRVGHLERIKAHIEEHGYPPTMSELADAVGVGRETMKKDLRVLLDEGLIEHGNARDAQTGDRTLMAPAGRAIRLTGYRVLVVPLEAGASA